MIKMRLKNIIEEGLLILDSITLVISYKYSIEMATGFMIISTIASIIIKYIKDKE
jgi:intracellular septation protein A